MHCSHEFHKRFHSQWTASATQQGRQDAYSLYATALYSMFLGDTANVVRALTYKTHPLAATGPSYGAYKTPHVRGMPHVRLLLKECRASTYSGFAWKCRHAVALTAQELL